MLSSKQLEEVSKETKKTSPAYKIRSTFKLFKMTVSIEREQVGIWSLIERIGELGRLLRVTALIRRFASKHARVRIRLPVSLTEEREVFLLWVRRELMAYYQEELALLQVFEWPYLFRGPGLTAQDRSR